MAKYVKYWNVGGGMKANAYYGSKMITRKRRRKQKITDEDLGRGGQIFMLSIAYIILMGMLLLIGQ